MLRNLPLRNKLMLSYLAIALIIVVVAVEGYTSARSMYQGSESLYSDRVLPLEQLGATRINLDRIWADLHRYLLVPEDRPVLRKEVAAGVEDIGRDMKRFRATYLIPEEKEWLAKFDEGFAAYQKAVSASFDQIDSGNVKDASLALHEGHPTRLARNSVRVPIEKLTGIQVRVSEELHRASAAHFSWVRILSITAGLLGVVLAVVLGLAVARSITKPLGKVVAMIDRMSEGQLDGGLTDDGRRDEIGQLTRAGVTISATVRNVSEDLRRMIDAVEAGSLSTRLEPGRHKGEFASLIAGINRLTETISRPLGEVAEVMQKVAGGDTQGRMVGAYEGELRAMKSNVNRSLDALGSLLGQLSEVAGKMAKGDLRSSLEGHYQGDFALMQSKMNTALEELRRSLGEIVTSSQQIAVAATETSAASGDVAGQSGRQLKMLTEVSTVLDETARSVKQISLNAERGNGLARTTAAQSREGRGQLAKLGQAIELIATSNAKVAQISDRISRIAEKTHILALNAGIEAARAGEHGLGFGIVAQQIGKLAEEAFAAVNDIATLTAESSQNVAGGVKSASETQSAIERIAQAADESEETVQGIASAIVQQATAVQQLSSHVAEVQAAGQSNAAAAAEISATMRSLSKMIHHAAAQSGRFALA